MKNKCFSRELNLDIRNNNPKKNPFIVSMNIRNNDLNHLLFILLKQGEELYLKTMNESMFYNILEGFCSFKLGESYVNISEGGSIFIPFESFYEIVALSDVTLLETGFKHRKEDDK